MFRYLGAGLFSIAMHFLIFAPLIEQPAMAASINQQTQSVSISFASPVKPKTKKIEQPTPKQNQAVVAPLKPQKVEAKQPIKQTQKKRIVKNKTIPKKVKKITPKIVKKTTPVKETAKKIVKSKKTIANTAQIQTKSSPTSDKPITKKAQPIVNKSSGAQDQPPLIQKSRFLSTPTPPKYPRLAKRKKIEGIVTYEVWLDEKGKQVKLLLKDSSGAKMLDIAALKAIKKWKFSPHMINGKSIAHRIYIPIRFKLD